MTATTAASVGVNTPPRMPPKMMTGISNAQDAATKAWRRSLQGARGSGLRPSRLASKRRWIISAAVMMKAGRKPAANRVAIDVLVMLP